MTLTRITVFDEPSCYIVVLDGQADTLVTCLVFLQDVQSKVTDAVLGKEKPVEESNPEYEKLKHYIFELENHMAEAQKHAYRLVKRHRGNKGFRALFLLDFPTSEGCILFAIILEWFPLDENLYFICFHRVGAISVRFWKGNQNSWC